jgi:hypothetical protein
MSDKQIPISELKALATANNLKQVVLFGWDGEHQHVVTYGDSIEDCDQAAQAGDHLKKQFKWDKGMDIYPSRVQALKNEISELNAKHNRQLEKLLAKIEEHPTVLSDTNQSTKVRAYWYYDPSDYRTKFVINEGHCEKTILAIESEVCSDFMEIEGWRYKEKTTTILDYNAAASLIEYLLSKKWTII